MEHRLKLGVKNELLVVFSPINIPKGKFGFTRFFSDLEQHVLFFNCENTWYVDCIDEMKSVFEEVVSIHRPNNIVFYGASMGAYAADRIGGQYPKHPTFLFGPEVKLYTKGSLSEKHATIRREQVNLDHFKNLNFSNTVGLFGIYEPVDMLQYKASLSLNFFATFPVKSPHAVHEELYYRNLVTPLSRSNSVHEFIENIPEIIIDNDPPVQYAEFLHQNFFQRDKNTDSSFLQTILEINHPLGYWVALRKALMEKNHDFFRAVCIKLDEYFQVHSPSFSMPNKFKKEMKRIASLLDLDSQE